MKKKVVSAALAAMFTMSAGAALANPIELKGDLRLQWRNFNNDIIGVDTTDDSFFQYRIRLNATTKIDENTELFVRYSDRNKIDKGNRMPGELDWYGVKGKLGDWNYSVGRQSVTLGQGSVISTGDDAAVATNLFGGIVASTTDGQVNVQVMAGETTDNKDWFGFDASTKVNDKINAGVAFAKDSTTDINYYALNATYKAAPNLDLAAEFVKSDADTLDTGYFIAGTYSWDKNSFTVQYNNVEANAADSSNSGIGGVSYPMMVGFTPANSDGYSGFTYVYGRPITEDLSFNAAYLDLKADGKAGSAKEFASALVYKF